MTFTHRCAPVRGPRARSLALALAFAAGAAAPMPLLGPTPVLAQQEGPLWTGEMGVTETVAQLMAREAAAPKGPLRLIESDEREEPDRSRLPMDPNSPAVPQWPLPGGDVRPGGAGLPVPIYPVVGQPGGEIDNPQTIALNFLALQMGEQSPNQYFPPDTQCAVGTTQIMAVANGRVKVFSK